MGVRIEAWPLAADDTGIWLLGDGAWYSDRVPAYSTVHGELELMTWRHTQDAELAMILAEQIPVEPEVMVNHSTSWRETRGNILLTYAVVFDCGDLVQERWDGARGVTLKTAQACGKPKPHDPADQPVDRRNGDVLFHTLRHLRFLVEHDTAHAERLGPRWARHLEPFKPVLAGLYQE